MSEPVYTFADYFKAEREAEDLARGDGPWPRWCVVEDFAVQTLLVMPDEAAERYVEAHDAEIQYTAVLPPAGEP
jgi:hypothetical protein